jgi:hypothetical protein
VITPSAEETASFDSLANADRKMANGEWLFTDDDFKGWLFVL